MPNILVLGDSAGGAINGGVASNVFIGGKPVALKGASIASHGIAPHSSAIMVGASSKVFANGVEVCRNGDLASCGHSAIASNSTVSAN